MSSILGSSPQPHTPRSSASPNIHQDSSPQFPTPRSTPRASTPRSLTSRKKEILLGYLQEYHLDEKSEHLLRHIEPLLRDNPGGPRNTDHGRGSFFPLELLWILCRSSFGDTSDPSPEFLTLLEDLQSKSLIYESNDGLYELKSDKLFDEIQSDVSQWNDYYSYWAQSLITLNQGIYTKDISEMIQRYQRFQNHYEKLMTMIRHSDRQSPDDFLRDLGGYLGGHVGRICDLVVDPSIAYEFTQAIYELCLPPSMEDMTKHHPSPSTYLLNSGYPVAKVPQPTISYVGAIIEYASYIRLLKHTLPKVLDLYYNASLFSLFVLRNDESWRLNMESLLQIAITQHEQYDRLTGQETPAVSSALSENVEYLYLEIISKCESAPRGIQPDREVFILLSRAQAHLALLYATFERYEESTLLLFKSLANKKLVLPETHPFIAETYFYQAYLHRDQGNYESARECYDIALNIFQIAYPPSSVWIAKCYVGIGLIDDDEGNDETALVHYAKGVEIYQKYIQPRYLPTADVFMNIGALLNSQGRYVDALEAYESALEIYKYYFLSIPTHPDIVSAEKACHELRLKLREGDSGAVVADDKPSSQLNFPQPSEDCVIPVQYFQRGYHTSFPESVCFLATQALLMENHEFYADAEVAYRDALEICRRVESAEIESELLRREKQAELRKAKNMQSQQQKQSLYVQTEEDDESPVEDQEEDEDDESAKKYTVTSASPYIAYLLQRIAGILEEVYRSDADSKDKNLISSTAPQSPLTSTGEIVTLQLILSLYEESLMISRLTIGEESLLVADVLVKLGQVYCYEDEVVDLTMSDHLLDEALTIYSLIWRSDDHRDIFETKYLLARTVSLQGNYTEANQICEEIIEGYQLMHSHLAPAPFLSSPSRSLFSSDDSLSLEDKLAVHTDLANSLNNYANILQEQANYPLAEKYYRISLNIYHRIYSADLRTEPTSKLSHSANISFVDNEASLVAHPLIARAYNNLGSLYDDMNDHTSAKEMYEKALAILSELYSTEGHPQIAIVAINLASLLSSESLNDEAKALYEIALAIYRDKYGENHPSVKETLLLLEKADTKQSMCLIQ